MSDSQVFTSRAAHRDWLTTQAALPAGFRVGAHRFSFQPREVTKPAKMTLSLIAADHVCESFAAVFTRNAFPGAPILVGRRRLRESHGLQAVVINNKISNVCAADGEANAEAVCTAVAAALGCEASAVLPSSTGVIGWRLPVDELVAAVPQAVDALQADSILPLADGIVTTDLYAKIRRVDLPGGGSVVGVAKGAGMIEPNMATMLSYILTDVAIDRQALQEELAAAAGLSFNAISIDTDQSTSDTLVALASGRVAGVDRESFAAALRQVCAALAEDLVRNGEGVHHVVRVQVDGAPDAAIAKGVGKAVVSSPLLQCAICGNDPNVGRLVAAVGKYLGNEHPGLDLRRTRMAIGGIEVFADGVFRLDPEKEKRLQAAMREAELYASTAPDANGVFSPPIDYPPHQRCLDLHIDLGLGAASFTVTGCDRSHEYISENADYRS